MDHFYDETVAEVSTPVVTPVASIIEPIEQKVEMAPPPPPPVADNTLDNLIDDEGRFMNYFPNDEEAPAFVFRTLVKWFVCFRWSLWQVTAYGQMIHISP